MVTPFQMGFSNVIYSSAGRESPAWKGFDIMAGVRPL